MARQSPTSRFIPQLGRLALLPALAALVFAALPAHASGSDWANVVYSKEGVEVRADERVFTLFAAFNELGHDDAAISRTAPVPKRAFHPVRQSTRDAVGMAPALRAKFEAFFDQKPQPIRSYLAYTLHLGPAPAFQVPEALPAELASLKGFEALLKEFHARAKIQELFQKVSEAQRDALRTYAQAVDKPIAEARKLLKRPMGDDSPHLVVIVNLLDAESAGYGLPMGEDSILVVGAPGEELDPSVVARAFARSEIQAAAAGKGSGLRNGAALFAEASKSLSLSDAANLDDYVADSLARVVGIRAGLPAGQVNQALDQEFRSGFVLVKELNRGMAVYAKGGQALGPFLSAFLREIDTAKLLAALKGS